MISVESGFVANYVDAVTSAVGAFLPLISATIGIFLAFAIANSLRHFIQKTVFKIR
jgi:uncharacterized membrane protein